MPADPLPPLDELTALGSRIPPGVAFGTSSWNYPGWVGMIYQKEYPKTGAAARMLGEYARFPLFRTVGVDSSFYGPLTPSQLAAYAEALPPGFKVVQKVWDRITVHSLPKARYKDTGGEANPDFLNPELFLSDVLGPCEAHFPDHLGPFVFEFQQISHRDRIDGQQFADRLDAFFSRLPREIPYAVEIRNSEYLVPPYFAVLREHNVAHLFNSWTRMPDIGEQAALPGAFSGPFVIARVLLRPGRTYNEAVDAFAPYDRIQDENPELRADVVALIRQAMALRIPAYILVNNRAEGSAPHTILAIARMLIGGGG